VSLLGTQTADAAAELVDLLIAKRHPRVVALSIDGNEATAGRTGPRFAEAFRRAGAAGFKRTVHAGESSGPEGSFPVVILADPTCNETSNTPTRHVDRERRLCTALGPTSQLRTCTALFDRCERKTGIAPFERLVAQIMRKEPYRSAPRVRSSGS
jgi:hypothetical protein